MRNGTYDLVRSRKQRVQSPDGYQWLYKPDHILAHRTSGYVPEHRFLIYEKYGVTLPDCEICGKPTNWQTCHIDHIDKNTGNNEITNLRPLCPGCNTWRDYPEQHTIRKNHSITYDGQTMTAAEWSRKTNVHVSGRTIILRLASGMTVEEALFSEKKTHNGKIYVNPRKTKKNHERKNAIIVVLDGVTMTAADASRLPLCKVGVGALVKRIKLGMPHHEAVFSAPKTGKFKKVHH
jgi:hypothetical protein